jgi:hypothetical protein
MELELLRTYHPTGTNGEILLQGRRICYCIELPWKNNHAQVSCIPEGRYELKERWSPKFLRHLQVMNVKDRDLVLIHPANDAMHELKGCIAPVSFLTGPGKGTGASFATIRVNLLVSAVLDQGNPVFLTIKKEA